MFRWGDPPHVYSIKAIDGLLQDEETGTRYASEVLTVDLKLEYFNVV